MSLPVDYNTVDITGHYVYLNGNPVSGSLKFIGKVVAVSGATNTIIVPNEIIVPLDENGEFSVPIPATDDPDIDPNGWTYTVIEQWPGGRTFEIDVPVAATETGIDISMIAPTTPSSGDPTAFVTLTTFYEHTHEGGGGSVAWADITGKPTTFTPSPHTHDVAEIIDLEDILSDLESALGGKADAIHTHAITDVIDLEDGLNGKADSGHSHEFEISDIPGLQDILDDKVGQIHTHTISDVIDLQTTLDSKLTGLTSSTDNEVPRFDGTSGGLVQTSGVTISDDKDVAGIRRITRTFGSSLGSGTWIDRIDLNFAVDVPDPDLLRVYVQSALVFWQNENGFIRGTPRSNYKDDAVLRGRARSDLSNQQGGYIELEDSSSNKLHARRWTDGALIRGNGSGTVVCSDVIVLEAADPLPAGTPTNTVVIRLEA